MDLDRLTNTELLRLSREILTKLRARGVIRTGNAPAGDYAEQLVRHATDGALEPNSNKSWDVETATGEHLQVKARVVVDLKAPGQRQLSVFRSWDFDAAVIVLFDDGFAIRRAARLSAEQLRAAAWFNKYVSGYRVLATDALLDQGEDWTQRLRRAATADDLGTTAGRDGTDP